MDEEQEELSILVVDDDGELLNIIDDYLTDYNIIKAKNGLEAVQLYEKHKPEIVLMDIIMPEMDGIEATRRILDLNPEATILAMTGHASSKKQEAIAAGVTKILPKPLRLPNLLQQIEDYVQRLSDNILQNRVSRLEQQSVMILRKLDNVEKKVDKLIEEPNKISEIIVKSMNKLFKIIISLYNVTMLVVVLITKVWSSTSIVVFIQENKTLIIMVVIGLGLFLSVIIFPSLRNSLKGKSKTKKKAIFALTKKEREEAMKRLKETNRTHR